MSIKLKITKDELAGMINSRQLKGEILTLDEKEFDNLINNLQDGLWDEFASYTHEYVDSSTYNIYD
jgi:hypothetical protein